MRKNIFAIVIIAVMSAFPTYAEILAGSGIAVVDVEGGKLQGYIRNGIFTYHGVPYAEAEPFMPPTKLKAWDDVRMAVTYRHFHFESLVLASLGASQSASEQQLSESQHLDTRTR